MLSFTPLFLLLLTALPSTLSTPLLNLNTTTSPSPSLSQTPPSNLPPPTFSIIPTRSSALLPIPATLMNFLFTLGLNSGMDPTTELPPNTYTAPRYDTVEIKSFAWTEARFLMWGIYKLAVEMCKYARFLETEVDLMFEGKMVGRLLVRARKRDGPNPSSGNGNGVIEERGDGYLRLPTTLQTNSTDLNVQQTNEPSTDFLTQWHHPLSTQNTTTTTISLTTPNTSPPSSPGSPKVLHNLIPIPKGATLGRNAVFLTVFAGLLHTAQFQPDEQMVDFEADSPRGNVSLMMGGTRLSCSYGRVTNLLTFLPRFMLENPVLEWRESGFTAEVFGMDVCRGWIMKNRD